MSTMKINYNQQKLEKKSLRQLELLKIIIIKWE